MDPNIQGDFLTCISVPLSNTELFRHPLFPYTEIFFNRQGLVLGSGSFLYWYVRKIFQKLTCLTPDTHTCLKNFEEFFEVLKNSQKDTCVGVSLFNKV